MITQDFGAANGRLRFQLNDTGTHDYDVGTKDVSDNLWHHVVLSVNRTTNRASLYVDGAVDIANVNISAVTGSLASTNPIEIGRDQIYCGTDAVACRLTGTMDDVRVYNRALSAGEVEQLYNMGR